MHNNSHTKYPVYTRRSLSPRSLRDNLCSEAVHLKPQASDDATTNPILGYVIGLTLYVWYTMYNGVKNCSCDSTHSNIVEPQADEVITQSVGTTDTKSQNVTFVDTHPGYTTTVAGGFDALRDAPFAQDATLDEFFSRPLRIVTKDWGVGLALFEEFNPWDLYFKNPRVINRIANYKLLRAKLHMKVTVNGNAFHYGRAIMSYNPLPVADTLTVDRAFLDVDFVGATQRPHVYIDPTNSQGGEMSVPFFYYKNAVDVVTQDWAEIGECVLSSIQLLKHANGAADSVTVNVFAWATDVKFAVPTQIEPGSIAPQADEYSAGLISRPAAIIANVASKMSAAPLIGPYARATEIGARAAGAMASLFGYSKPIELQTHVGKLNAKNNMAVLDCKDDAIKLSADSKTELSIDSRLFGLDGTDEMAINYIASRESYINKFTWALNTAQEVLLWNAMVDPGLHRKQAGEIHLTAPAFAVMPFRYWRGSMEFRFQVVCSKYHKGRLKIVYDPTGNPSGSAEYNTAYTTVVDISDTTDFTVKCGWGQSTPYRSHLWTDAAETATMSTTPLSYISSTSGTGNGTIAVYVVNELTVPNTTVNNDIEINVFVKMCDDFEVAVPWGDEINRLWPTSATAQTLPQSEDVEPQADDMPNDGDEQDRMDSAPMGTEVIDTYANGSDVTDYANHAYFGESIRSMRQIVKRYLAYEVLTFPETTVEGERVITKWTRNIFPQDPGYSNTTSLTGVNRVLTDGSFFYAQNSILRYVSLGYAGYRGSVRWMIDSTQALSDLTSTNHTIHIDRTSSTNVPQNSSVTVPDPVAVATGRAFMATAYDEVANLNGGIIGSSSVNKVLSAELPYYSRFLFTPAKQRSKWDTSLTNNECFTVTYCGRASPSDYLVSYCAAGEDFTCFFYTGPPILYESTSFPGV